ncbi:MAG: hypothetical protein Q9183_000495 [Haloplaca sp. 2 TL-2023]
MVVFQAREAVYAALGSLIVWTAVLTPAALCVVEMKTSEVVETAENDGVEASEVMIVLVTVRVETKDAAGTGAAGCSVTVLTTVVVGPFSVTVRVEIEADVVLREQVDEIVIVVLCFTVFVADTVRVTVLAGGGGEELVIALPPSTATTE